MPAIDDKTDVAPENALGPPTASAYSGERAIHASIEPLFQKLSELCSLPSIAQQVIQVAEDPDSDADDLLAVVEQDAPVASRLIQVVNSAYCGLRNPVGDLKGAVTLLGTERVRNLALTVSVGSLFGRDTPVGRLDPVRLWDHSVCVATVARLVAQRGDNCNPEEAYLAGLLHDIGLLFINEHLSSVVPRVLVRCKTGVALPEAERQVMAFDHAQVGAYVAWRANFPDRLVTAIDYHHVPLMAPDDGAALTRVVSVANYLATRYGRGSVEGRRLPAPPEGVLKPMGLGLNAFREIWEELPETVANVAVLTGA
ncbi:HDOD domain-containing protein [Botrimarina sp.]|uniref:HDOD domain-containing protein n=1 Tax=Botrimarina sp. TaxID=2795802 RepID=UPI0032EDC540